MPEDWLPPHATASHISWVQLREHVLFRVLSWPHSSGGALAYLHMLKDCAISTQLDAAWEKEIEVLLNAAVRCNLSNGQIPTAKDLSHPYVNAQERCRHARQSAKYTKKNGVDHLYLRAILFYAAQGRVLPIAVLRGVTQLYKVLVRASQKLNGWLVIAEGLEGEARDRFSDYLPLIKKKTQRTMAICCDRILDSPTPACRNEKSLEEIRKFFALEKSVNNINKAQDSDTTTILNKTKMYQAVSSEEIEAKFRPEKFSRGDSVMEYLMSGLQYQERPQRLGISSKSSIPIAHMCQIVRSLLRRCNQASLTADEVDVNLLALLQISLPLPFHVLMNVSLVDSNDIRLDADHGCIRFNMGKLLKLVNPDELDEKQIVLPLPLVVAEPIRRRWLEYPFASYLSELFGAKPNTQRWRNLDSKHRVELKQCSDINFKAWSGKWVRSIGNVYLHVLGNNLQAAICGLSPRLANGNILNYFHPSAKDLERSCSQVFVFLGLGAIKYVVLDTFQFSGKNPTHEELKKGFDAMLSSLNSATRVVSGKGPLSKKIESFNECSRISLAILVFSIGGRGSKPEEITNGAIYGSDEMLFWNDKQVEEDRGPRLVPKISLAKRVLTQYGLTQVALAKDLIEHMPKSKNEIWHELAHGQYRFNAPAFNQLEIKGNELKRQPLRAEAVEDMSMAYFKRGKNFMRHVLVTMWGTEHRDHNLLRVITGHAALGLEMPAAASVYSPTSAIRASGVELEKVFSKWMSPSWGAKKLNFKCNFLALPMQSIYRHAQTSRRVIEEGLRGPKFGSSHLAAEFVVKRVRLELLKDGVHFCDWSGLWLHLLMFDGFFEKSDLEKIFSKGKDAFTLGPYGWNVRWRRLGDLHDRVVPLQMPTSVYLHRCLNLAIPFDLAFVESNVNQWLTESTPDFFERRINPIDFLTAAVSLWLDLSLPTALQLAFSPRQFAPIPTTHASLKLLGMDASCSTKTRGRHTQTGSLGEELAWIYSTINKIGTNKSRLGELRACANYYEAEVAQRLPFSDGAWPQAIHRCITFNNELIRSSKPSRLEFSSVATYMGTLRPAISSLELCFPGEFNELDFIETADVFFAVSARVESEENSDHSRRQHAQHAAAMWFLKTLQIVGYAVPNDVFIKLKDRTLLPAKVTAVSHIAPYEFEEGVRLSQSWCSENSLRLAKLDATTALMREAPLRWRECASLMSSSLLTVSCGVVIKPVGLSHLKSENSHRLLLISGQLHQKLLDLNSRVRILNGGLLQDEFIFLDSEAKSLGDSANWIHQSLTQSMSLSSNDADFRIHHLRARAISYKLFEQWDEVLNGYLTGRIGPNFLQEYFSYTKEKAWRVDEVCVLAGHSRPRTTILFYFYPHHFLRAMALSALFAFERPNEKQLLGVNAKAEISTCTRRKDIKGRIDPWLLPAERLVDSPKISHKRNPRSDAHTFSGRTAKIYPLSESLEIFDAVIYLFMRLRTFEVVNAADIARITISQASYLEKIFHRKSRGAVFSFVQRVSSEFAEKTLTADSYFRKSEDFCALFNILRYRNELELKSIFYLVARNDLQEDWVSCLINVANVFNESGYCLEVVCDVRYSNAALNARFAKHSSIRFGTPIPRLGRTPRVTLIHPKQDQVGINKRLLQFKLLVLVWALCSLVKRETESNGKRHEQKN